MAPSKKVARKLAVERVAVTFLLADDFRVENTGKVLGVGLYPDSVVVLKVPESAPPPTKTTPYGLDLSLLVSFVAEPGEYDIAIAVGKNPAARQVLVVGQGGSANLIAAMKPFLFSSFGRKDVRVYVGADEHEYSFEIRHQKVSDGSVPPGQIFELPRQLTKPAAKKAQAKRPKA